MPNQVVPIEGLDTVGLIADVPAVSLPPNAFSDCNNVRFRNGNISKVKGDLHVFSHVHFGDQDVLKYVVWWPSPNLAAFNQGYYVLIVEQGGRDFIYVLKVGELGTEEEPILLAPANIGRQSVNFTPNGNWQHTFFQGGFALVINNGLDAPHYLLDPSDNTAAVNIRTLELPGWNSYAADIPGYSGTDGLRVTAGVIRTYGDFLIAGNLVERQTDGTLIRGLPGTIRTSDIAAPGDVPQNWNPFATGVNTADEFVITSDGVVQDFVELQGNMYVYSNSSISVISRTNGGPAPFSVRPVTSAYGALTTDSVVEFDGRHLVIGSGDIYVFAGHPGSIQSLAQNKIRDYFYRDLAVDDIDQVFIIRYSQEDEIWICYPSQTATESRSDRALIWNYRTNVWTKRDINGAFAGTAGPVPGGGIPSAEYEFEGTAVLSETTPGQTHSVSVDNLSAVTQTGTGETYEETLSFTTVPTAAASSGNPKIRVTLGENFSTGDNPALRMLIRATDIIGNTVVNINICLPEGLGQGVSYNTFEYQQTVLNPIISSLANEPAVMTGQVSVSRADDPDLMFSSIDVEFDLGVLNLVNVSPSVNITRTVSISEENDLATKDRPNGTTTDRLGHILADSSFPVKGNVFEFNFADIMDDLDNYVFFFKGMQTGVIGGRNRFDDLPAGSQVHFGTLTTSTTSSTSDGGMRNAGSTVEDPMDGHERVNTDFGTLPAANLLTAPLLGTRVRELLTRGNITGQSKLDLHIQNDSDTYSDFNLIAYRIPAESNGVADVVYTPLTGGLIRLNFFNATYDKSQGGWIKGTAIDSVAAGLSFTPQASVVPPLTQGQVFARSVMNALEANSDFVGTSSGEITTITSVANSPYILEIELENLLDATDEEIPASRITRTLVSRGIYAYSNSGLNQPIIPPCIRVSHTDPNGIDFFSFDTGLIELRKPTGNSTLTSEEQLEMIDSVIQRMKPGQWTRSGSTWTTTAVSYNEANGDSGVPVPNVDGTYEFPAERQGAEWVIEEFIPGIVPGLSTPTSTVDSQGSYEATNQGSFFAINLSNMTTYMFPINNTNIATSLNSQISIRIPELRTALTNSDQGIRIEPTVIGENTVYVVEAFFNTTDTITDFRRLIDVNNFTQDDFNAAFRMSLPDAVLRQPVSEFPSIDNGPLISSSDISTEFDLDRTWPSDEVDFGVEFPLFASGSRFTNGNTQNSVTASEIGYTFLSFTPTQITSVNYESFFERKMMGLSPEFNTEMMNSVAVWADGRSPTTFLSQYKYNTLTLSLIPTNNPGQIANLSSPTQTNTFYISEDYKMDTRITGRFLNWRISDQFVGTRQSPGGKTFSQDTEWRVSGLQLSIRKAGRR